MVGIDTNLEELTAYKCTWHCQARIDNRCEPCHVAHRCDTLQRSHTTTTLPLYHHSTSAHPSATFATIAKMAKYVHQSRN